MRATDVLNGLNDYLPYPVIFAEQTGPKPSYPYVALKVLVDNISNGNQPSITNTEFEQTATTQPTMSISVTGYGTSFDEAADLVKGVHDWFSFVGYRALKNKNLVVSSIESIMNRDSLIVDDYERRRGFDVMLRYTHSIKRSTGIIESASLKIDRIKE